MTKDEFNSLTSNEKWDWFKEQVGNWHCKWCGAEMEGEEPYHAQPFWDAQVCCGDCEGILTRRTGGGQNDPFNWELR
jgi:hypothetical protein